jgi:hypothetical protein
MKWRTSCRVTEVARDGAVLVRKAAAFQFPNRQSPTSVRAPKKKRRRRRLGAVATVARTRLPCTGSRGARGRCRRRAVRAARTPLRCGRSSSDPWSVHVQAPRAAEGLVREEEEEEEEAEKRNRSPAGRSVGVGWGGRGCMQHSPALIRPAGRQAGGRVERRTGGARPAAQRAPVAGRGRAGAQVLHLVASALKARALGAELSSITSGQRRPLEQGARAPVPAADVGDGHGRASHPGARRRGRGRRAFTDTPGRRTFSPPVRARRVQECAGPKDDGEKVGRIMRGTGSASDLALPCCSMRLFFPLG